MEAGRRKTRQEALEEQAVTGRTPHLEEQAGQAIDFGAGLPGRR